MTVMTNSSLSTDQRKFLAAKLLRNTYLKLVCASVCSSAKFERGSGLTGYFIRYKRMNVPVTTITEGSDPTPSSFTIESVTVTLEQWGDSLQITDVAKLTTAHPVMQLAQQLLSDNAQRVIDREVQLVWLAGTNIIYGDGAVTTRATITKDMKASDDVIGKAYVTLGDAGAQPRGAPGAVDNYDKADTGKPSTLVGPQAYLGICGMQITQDVRRAAMAYGTWAAVGTYNSAQDVRMNVVGLWNGIRWVETNFIPKYQRLGSATVAVTTTNSFGTNTPTITSASTGGTLTDGATYYWKITAKDLTRGFEEYISIEHTTAATSSANTNKFTFDFALCTAGYVFNVYFGSATGDSNLKQFSTTNIAVGSTAVVTAVPSSTTTAPASLRASGDGSDPSYIHVLYLHGEESCIWSELQDLEFMVVENKPAPGNLLGLNQWVSYKFLGKAMRCNESFMLRCEFASTN